MPIKITPLVDANEFYIVPYERTSVNFEICIKFEMEHITLSTYECIRSFLKDKRMDSKEFGYIITQKFEGDCKKKESYRIQNDKYDCIIHNISI
jgi:hypothetical protein